MTKRKDWIDGLRALAMLIVMIWHFSNNVDGQWVYSILTAPIMIPLFFAITGYVFNSCEGNARIFYRKLFIHLVIPWLLLAIIKGGGIAIIRQSLSYYIEFLLHLFTGENLWYFPCCIIAEILHFYVLKFSNGNTQKVVLLSLVLVAVGFIISIFDMSHYLNISTAFICQFFLLLGHMARLAEKNSLKSKMVSKLSPLAVLTYTSISLYLINTSPINSPNGIAMDVHLDKYYCGVLLAFLAIVSGLLILYVLAPKFQKYPRFIKFIGRNTIVFYTFHYDTLMPLSLVCQRFGYNLSASWGGVFVCLLWSIVVCSVISITLNKYFPILVGKGKVIIKK